MKLTSDYLMLLSLQKQKNVPVIILNKLGERLLQNVGPVLEVWKGVEDLPVEAVQGRLPRRVKVRNDSGDPRFL